MVEFVTLNVNNTCCHTLKCAWVRVLSSSGDTLSSWYLDGRVRDSKYESHFMPHTSAKRACVRLLSSSSDTLSSWHLDDRVWHLDDSVCDSKCESNFISNHTLAPNVLESVCILYQVTCWFRGIYMIEFVTVNVNRTSHHTLVPNVPEIVCIYRRRQKKSVFTLNQETWERRQFLHT